MNNISAIPTNVITGFLGVGKTTVIQKLLQQKPSAERWAVLVNEFGEVGIDGSLFKGKYGEEQGVFISEVPGGCMCCASGLPMQITLNQLLVRAKPDRLLIEPTGLGHPKEVLELLSSDYYQTILSIQQCITLVDARKITDSRYTEHDTFNQQIDMADKIVGHKSDLYDEDAGRQLLDYVAKRRVIKIPVVFAAQGNVDIALLDGASAVISTLRSNGHSHKSTLSLGINEQSFPESGILSVKNSGEGYQSIGWRFSPQKIFNRRALYNWLTGLRVERAKGVFITNEGVFGYNYTSDTLTEMTLDDCLESRIEIINQGDAEVCETGLLECLVNLES